MKWRTRLLVAAVMIAATHAQGYGEPSSEPRDLERIRTSLRALQIFDAVPLSALRDLFYLTADTVPPRTAGPRSNETKEISSATGADATRNHGHDKPLLIGIVIKDTGKEAYFIERGMSHTVREGGILVERYRIEHIGPTQLRWRDAATGRIEIIDWDANE